MIEKKLPNSPGVYLFKDSFGRIIYVGKAASLKIRVASYWKNTEKRIKKLVQEIDSIDYKKTETVIEALILEANLIKELEPKYNIKGKDNKTFLYVLFKKERFPTPLLIRGHELEKIKKRETLYLFGPYTSASSIREALNILRNIFPWACQRAELKKRICFYYQVKKCSGVCTQQIDEKEYTKMIKNLILFFKGEKEKIIKNLKKEMQLFSKREKFEKAAETRNQIRSLEHVQDIALIKKDIQFLENNFKRIEGYDISNISGKFAVGSMVVFKNGLPEKSEYRKFKIKTVEGINDTAMLEEILNRRFKNNWENPDLILIDGGLGQVNIAKKVVAKYNLKVPIIGIAKGVDRKNNKLIFDKKVIDIDKNILISVRDEAHRFAIKYHRELRRIK